MRAKWVNTLVSHLFLLLQLFPHHFKLFILIFGHLLCLVSLALNIIFCFWIIILTIFGYILYTEKMKPLPNFYTSQPMCALNLIAQSKRSSAIMVVNTQAEPFLITWHPPVRTFDSLALTRLNKTDGQNACFVP